MPPYILIPQFTTQGLGVPLPGGTLNAVREQMWSGHLDELRMQAAKQQL